ncbi:hypothetical protein ACQJBY_072407 [Aegilops geniculata]
MAVQGVAWGISVAGLIMSPIISKLLDKVLSYCKFDKEETLHRLLTDVLPRLTLTLEAAEAINHRPFFEGIVSGLKSAFYDIEDIFDDLEYIRHQKKLNEQKRSSSTQKKKRPKIASDAEAGPSNQGICIEPSLTLTAALNARLKDKMVTIEKLIDKAQDIMSLAKLSSKDESANAKKIHSRTTSTPMEMVTGRDEDRDRIIEMLCDTKDDASPTSSDSKCFSAIGIYGISGSGKTTLAQHICKYEKIKDHFDLVMWIHVSNNYSVGDILKEMFEAASVDKRKPCPGYNNLDVLQKELEKKLDGKRFLLVLDDIWCNKDVSEQHLQKLLSPLNVGKRGSKILATSRNKDAFSDLGPGVACNVFAIPTLDELVFLELFMYYAVDNANADDLDQTELRTIGAEIAQKLRGSPLAASTVGGQLRKRKNDVDFWREVRDRDLLNETTGTLWWSYQHLDEQVRRCFAYCSIFPRRHRLDRDNLVKLWVAEGFIQTTNAEEDMEAVGRDYFHELLATSFLQQGYYEGKLFYFVHDLMHDLAEQAAVSDCFRIENGLRRKISHDVRHLFVAHTSLITYEILELENLRTLIIQGWGMEWPVPVNEFYEKLFEKLKKLRILDIGTPCGGLTYNEVLTIRATIGHLKHLRYLALRTPYETLVLPRTLANLYHMQALMFDYPIIVKVSPGTSMGNLTNLRHISGPITLDVRNSNIGGLTSLQTSPGFLLLPINSINSNGLEKLRYLNKLRGNLKINGLGFAKSKTEAQEAKLADKKGLSGLELSWSGINYCTREVEAEVLEALCPPKGLQSLDIEDYHGPRYPNWMVGEHNDSPKYLHTLRLIGCTSLAPAPELFEFFIHLREFVINKCSWDHLPDNVKDLRSLKRLTITSCLYLSSLPELPLSLQKLKVCNCNIEFMRSCEQIGHPNWQKIQHIDVKELANGPYLQLP